jgi:hypothetical protein
MAKTSEYRATAFFLRAREFLAAADELLGTDAGKKNSLRWYPTYFLYAHAVELTLKAFWRAHNPDVEYTHELVGLYEKCQAQGLVIARNDRTQIGNIVRLLDSANQDQGLRYFLTAGVLPDLAWTREVVTELMRVVEIHVSEAAQREPPVSNNVTGFIAILGKPVPQKG